MFSWLQRVMALAVPLVAQQPAVMQVEVLQALALAAGLQRLAQAQTVAALRRAHKALKHQHSPAEPVRQLLAMAAAGRRAQLRAQLLAPTTGHRRNTASSKRTA